MFDILLNRSWVLAKVVACVLVQRHEASVPGLLPTSPSTKQQFGVHCKENFPAIVARSEEKLTIASLSERTRFSARLTTCRLFQKSTVLRSLLQGCITAVLLVVNLLHASPEP